MAFINFSSILALWSLYSVLFCVSTAFNITKILELQQNFNSFNQYLTQTQVASDINGRQSITVLAVDDSNVASLSGESADKIKAIMSLHVILDYYDLPKLKNLPNKGAILTTLYQTSGLARDQTGFLNVTKSNGGIAFGSAQPGSNPTANLIRSMGSEPYNISVLLVSSLIIPPGIGGSNSTNSPPTPPSKSPSSQPPTAPAKPPAGKAPAPSQGKAPAPSQGKAPAPSRGKAPAPSRGNAPAPSQGNAPAPSQGNAPTPSQGQAPATPPNAAAPTPNTADTPTADTPTASPPASDSPTPSTAVPPAADAPGPAAQGPAADKAGAPAIYANRVSVLVMILVQVSWALALMI
ncbi:hypothetical protein K2173_019148 [Erythroxylum novogranatense]|uniref:FAS1 domain-containing protein n=1 Tax=Erythroxylum novogranatense TaxID=1862640 RepID=A0AAV8SSW9_9ROSI|nr:hypothetical protein K2173_019148 [Erythroxylum novogranatense]